MVLDTLNSLTEEKGMLAQNLENWIENERRESELKGKLEQAIYMINEFNLSVEVVAERCHLSLKDLMDRLSHNDTPKS